jgi:hypothetical protein
MLALVFAAGAGQGDAGAPPQLLLAVLPGYGAYRIRTAALLPGIF